MPGTMVKVPHHKQYDATAADWARIRDVLDGERAVKARGPEYLPMLSGMTPEDYTAYKMRTEFHEATARTLDGLTGAIFRKPPTLDHPEGAEEIIANITSRGTPFGTFAKNGTREVIAMGRYGVLVDALPNGEGNPFLSGYIAENILQWRSTVIDGKPVLTLVILREAQERPDPEAFYESVDVERFRVLELGNIDGDLDGAITYFQSVWEMRTGTEGGKELVMVQEPFNPKRRGAVLDFIPFVFLAPYDIVPDVQRSPILGLTNVNLVHYVMSADIQHGAHFTALPTPWVSGDLGGVSQEAGVLPIGSGVAWQLEKGATAGMLEYTGQGLTGYRELRHDTEKHMAVLGARLLEDQKSGVEAASAIGLRHRGENSLLASIADTVGRGLTIALNWVLWWSGGTEDSAKVELNSDFLDKPLAPEGIVQLVAAWQQGGIGGRTLYHNLVEGERLPKDMTFDEWQEDIEQNGPSAEFLGMGGFEPVDDDPNAPPAPDDEGGDADEE